MKLRVRRSKKSCVEITDDWNLKVRLFFESNSCKVLETKKKNENEKLTRIILIINFIIKHLCTNIRYFCRTLISVNWFFFYEFDYLYSYYFLIHPRRFQFLIKLICNKYNKYNKYNKEACEYKLE